MLYAICCLRREDFVGIGGQQQDDAILQLRQRYLPTLLPHGAGGGIHLQPAAPQPPLQTGGPGAVDAIAPQERLHPHRQLMAGDGLFQAVIPSHGEGQGLGALVRLLQQEQHRRSGLPPQGGAGVEAAHIRQLLGQDDKVCIPPQLSQQGGPTGGLLQHAVLPCQQEPQIGAQLRIRIGTQNTSLLHDISSLTNSAENSTKLDKNHIYKRI